MLNKIKNKAVKTALYGNVKRAKISAIAFSKSGTILAMAHNRRTDGHKKKWTQHAEEVLLYKLNRIKAFVRFNNISILVLRICKNGIRMAKPCKKCMKLLSKVDVKILYTDNFGSIKKLAK